MQCIKEYGHLATVQYEQIHYKRNTNMESKEMNITN